MKLLKNRIITNFTFLLFSLLITEITFRIISTYPVFNLSFLRVVTFNSIIAIILAVIFSLFKKGINNVLNLVFTFLFGFYSFIQIGFNNYIGTFMSVKTSSQLGAVADYIIEFCFSFKPYYYCMFIPFVIILLAFILVKKVINKKEYNYFKKKRSYEVIIGLIFAGTVIIGNSLSFSELLNDEYMADKYQVINNKSLFKTAENSSVAIKEFGVIPFGIIDLKSKNVPVSEPNISLMAYEKNPNRDIDDTAFEKVIQNESNSTYNKLHNYFINNKITEKNEYTGLFENKNLIVIMMESVNDIIVNERYYPNFYNMMQNGMYFTNNYSPRNSCATGNNEFSAMTGLYSIANMCTSNIYLNNKYPYSIFNLFNESGYTTNSFHNYNEGYYYRRTIHPNMGSGAYYDVRDLNFIYDPSYGAWTSDEELMTKYLEKIDEIDGNFMSYITTVSSHQPYSRDSEFGNMYLDLTEGTSYSMDMRRYMSKLKVLDNALGILTRGLEERNLLDDTVIILFGDHYPYGLSTKTLNEVLTRNLDDYETEKVPLLIYNKGMEKSVNEMYTSYLNLTPMVANLFNLDFDPRFYAGEDIFNKDYEDKVVFADGSWKNAHAYYNAVTGKITYYDDFIYEDEKLKQINNEIYTKMNTSKMAIQNNYFPYLKNMLDYYSEERTQIN